MAKQRAKSQAKFKTKNTLGLDLGELKTVHEFMTSNGIAELEWENAGQRFHLKMASATPLMSLAAMPMANSGRSAAAPSASSSAAGAVSAGTPSNLKQVPSPFVGTFYRASSPEGEPYVREGHQVKRGDVLCIVEAMKLMNEIESEVSGKVVSVLVENGQPVEYGEPLFLIETT